MRSSLVRSSLGSLLALSSVAFAQGAPRQAALATFASDSELSSFLYHASGAEAFAAAGATPCTGDGVTSVIVMPGPAENPAAPAIVRGIVVSTAGTPLASASVFAEGYNLGTLSKEDGSFQFEIPAGRLQMPKVLAISARLIGFRQRSRLLELRAGATADLRFTLCTNPLRLGEVVVTGEGLSDAQESITNVQQTGVDEGDIVKRHGRHLVILRRGQLFTVDIANGALKPASARNAFGPGIDPNATWYDEMLVYHDRVIVVGYSYARGGTEVGIFQLDGDGTLTHQATYQFRSHDYYSWRNYASRIVGNKLLLYTPLYMGYWADKPLENLPAMRKWRAGADSAPFKRLATLQHIYRPNREWSTENGVTLHTVTSCDLDSDDLTCDASVVLGPPGRVFYVSAHAAYVWTIPCPRTVTLGTALIADSGASMLFRLPFDGSAPGAIGVWGAPVDQFSFLESGDGHLNVMVRRESFGDWMVASGWVRGTAALLRLPIASLGDGSGFAPSERYRVLPAPAGDGFTNRFVGDYLLYGQSMGFGKPHVLHAMLFAVPWRGGNLTGLDLGSGVDRIEAMGSDAVVIGSDDQDLVVTGIRLGAVPRIVQRLILADAQQGETRSHGFFYHADGPLTGVIGLPLRSPDQRNYSQLWKSSAGVIFLRNDGADFQLLGSLTASADSARKDGCVASCADWYGNTRPIFTDGRVFALLGYELVEGRIRGNWMAALASVNYSTMK